MSIESPFVSVVTPFHDVEEYLEQCILSVLGQEYETFEYVLVDNCSTDGSRKIALKYAEMDSRIRFFSTDRLIGQVQNYNSALERISPLSKYCKIVQADDWVSEYCLRKMVKLAESDESIGLVSSFRLKGTQVHPNKAPGDSELIAGAEVCKKQLIGDVFYFGSPTTVMYRSDIIRSKRPFYEEGRLNEDTEACYELLKHWNFGFVNEILSFTRVDNDSVMSRVRSFNPHLLDRLIMITKFGRHYLSNAEYEERRATLERQYYYFLGASKLDSKGAGFWEYHRRGLRSIDCDLDSVNLSWFVFVAYVKKLFRDLGRRCRDSFTSSI